MGLTIRRLFTLSIGAAALCFFAGITLPGATPWTILAWSEFGINPMERDYSVFAIWPPYGTIRVQLIDNNGTLVKSGNGVTVTYEALADATGVANSTSVGKTNFWAYSNNLFGASAADLGIEGNRMPAGGLQPMAFDSAFDRFSASGIPITPYDDGRNLNYYPLMKVTARDASGNILASARVSLPVSNEVECRGCHASGANPAAAPAAGYANDPNPNRDFKLNILAVHDQLNKRNPAYISSLAAAGYPSDGLVAAVNAGNPVRCTVCHSSNLFSNAGISGVLPLTTAMHSVHAAIVDPKTNDILDNSTDRSACYNCHPGNATKALRGAMGHSVDSAGHLQIQCQSCHGNLSALGDPSRRGYLDVPNCQACHSTSLPRLTSALNSSGALNTTADTTFATTPNQPAAGITLFRASTGHGGLQCPACHGSTHAEYPSGEPNDNLQSTDIQGAIGPVKECTVCHRNGVSSTNGGPHGMHNAGSSWVSQHPDVADRSRTACAACHGTSYQGTVLSQAFVNRSIPTSFGTLNTFPGFQVSCYSCHNGPGGEGGGRGTTTNPTVSNTSAAAATGRSSTFPVTVSSGGALRIVNQPQGGTAFVSGNSITYQANADFEGTDQVTYAAAANNRDSNLGTAAVTVTSATRPVPVAPVSNAASFAPGAVAPGMITYIGGQGLGPANLATFELNSGGFIEKNIQSARVLFDGRAAPLLYTSAGALAAIAPYEIAGQTQTSMVVQYGGISSAPVAIPVQSAAPGIFTLDGSGRGQAAALNQDGTINSVANPAAKGSAISLYLTGDGVETPTPPDGQIAVAPFPQAGGVTVTIGGKPATVGYAGTAPGAVAGLMQVNATIPADAASGPNQVVVSVGSSPSAGAVTIQVK